jgi:uncharacterized protein involved in exopolysaccharide biosynthesis
MFMNSRPDDAARLNMTDLLVYLYKWRKPLLLVTISSIILAIIFSSTMFIDPKYKAKVIIYPTKTYSISKSVLGEKYSPDVLQFGEEIQAEQLIQVINSDAVKGAIIEKYDLVNHYEINPLSPKMRSQLLKIYDNNISVERTMFMSVKVEVLDKKPEIAAGIANDIVALVDSAWNGITRERASVAMEIIKGEYIKRLEYIHAIEDSLRKIAMLGIYDYDEQSRMLDRQYYKTVNKFYEASGALTELSKVYANDNASVIEARAKKRGAEEAMRAMEQKKDLIANYGSKYLSLKELATENARQFNHIKRRYDEAKIDLEKNLPFKFIVNSAEVPDRKAYPVRWLIVVLAAISAFVLCLGIILLIDNFNELKLRASES